LKEQVRTGGELLVFSVPEQVAIGKPQSVMIGVRNTAQSKTSDRVCFMVEIKCIKPFTPESFCAGNENDVTVGGYDFDQGPVSTTTHNWFKSILGEFDLKNFEGDVYDASMLVRGIKPDSYSMEINVYKDAEDRDCASAQFTDKAASLYASKTFILNVV
jgi:hypothetical protein